MIKKMKREAKISKSEVPKVEAPKVEAPKVEAPKVEATKVVAFRDHVVDAALGALRDLEIVDQARAISVGEIIADNLCAAESEHAAASDGNAPEFYDLRGEQDYRYPSGKRKAKMRGDDVVRRDPSTIDTIVIHQTAAEFGVSKQLVKASKGDARLALARRALDVACHAMAFRKGFFVAAHELTDYVNHGNRFNATSLGLEIDGRYAGLEDDPSTAAREDLATTWNGSPTALTEETIEAAKAAIRWLVEEGARQGITIRKLVSHRQSSDTRRSDPGEAIWKRIVVPVAEELGLEIDGRSPWNTGRPLPVQWDPKNGKGDY